MLVVSGSALVCTNSHLVQSLGVCSGGARCMLSCATHVCMKIRHVWFHLSVISRDGTPCVRVVRGDGWCFSSAAPVIIVLAQCRMVCLQPICVRSECLREGGVRRVFTGLC